MSKNNFSSGARSKRKQTQTKKKHHPIRRPVPSAVGQGESRAASTSTPTAFAPSAPQYNYVPRDLRRIGLVAAAMFIILAILAVVL